MEINTALTRLMYANIQICRRERVFPGSHVYVHVKTRFLIGNVSEPRETLMRIYHYTDARAGNSGTAHPDQAVTHSHGCKATREREAGQYKELYNVNENK